MTAKALNQEMKTLKLYVTILLPHDRFLCILLMSKSNFCAYLILT